MEKNMRQILSWFGYTDKLSDKNKFTYIVTGIGLCQILLFLTLYILLGVPSTLVIQTTVVAMLYVISIFLYKRELLYIGKNIMTLTMATQVFLLAWLWFPRGTYFVMYFFIIPPMAFIIFDLENKSERKSLIWINALVSLLIILASMTQSYELITLKSSYTSLIRFLTVVSTFLVEVVVFYFYAHRLSKTHKELRILANTDVLTNIANRRALFEKGEQIFKICHKYEKKFTLMILDIDFFKRVNDQFGHPVGDEVLKELTLLISKNIRKEDLLCRYGGEEFAVIFRNVHGDQESIIHTIREKIEKHHFSVSENQTIAITFSAGVVTCCKNIQNFSGMVNKADKLLYEAKTSGRNRIVFDNGNAIS
jgi:diguanylate cyclase (GGDEF)-like protein